MAHLVGGRACEAPPQKRAGKSAIPERNHFTVAICALTIAFAVSAVLASWRAPRGVRDQKIVHDLAQVFIVIDKQQIRQRTTAPATGRLQRERPPWRTIRAEAVVQSS